MTGWQQCRYSWWPPLPEKPVLLAGAILDSLNRTLRPLLWNRSISRVYLLNPTLPYLVNRIYETSSCVILDSLNRSQTPSPLELLFFCYSTVVIQPYGGSSIYWTTLTQQTPLPYKIALFLKGYLLSHPLSFPELLLFFVNVGLRIELKRLVYPKPIFFLLELLSTQKKHP